MLHVEGWIIVRFDEMAELDWASRFEDFLRKRFLYPSYTFVYENEKCIATLLTSSKQPLFSETMTYNYFYMKFVVV